MPEPLFAQLDVELPDELTTGAGTDLFVCGWCWSPQGRIRRLEFVWGGRRQPVQAQRMPRLDPYRELGEPLAYRSGFWGHVQVAPGAEGEMTLELEAELDDGTIATASLATLAVRPKLSTGEAPAVAPGTHPGGPPVAATWPPRSPQEQAGATGSPLVAICIAAHNPPAQLLRRQLDSIRAQTHEHWVCVISDDRSRPEAFRGLQDAVGGDPRFVISRTPRRLGFYRNFERALAMAPAEAEFVALCDQDDRWYPEKLAVLLAEIGDAPLIYSDARVVTRDGDVISNTYWPVRTNNHSDLWSLLSANCVTGAASMLPAGLLADALPFPPRQFFHYHDHWLALVACAQGQIRFVGRPLYDYVQHGGQALGHERANRITSLADRVRRRFRLGVQDQVRKWRMHYFVDVQRLLQMALILEARVTMPAAKRRDLRRFLAVEHSSLSWLRLLRRGLLELSGQRRDTLAAEWILFLALLWRRALEWSARDLPQSRLRLDALPPDDLAPGPEDHERGEPGGIGPTRAIAAKLAPLDLDVLQDAPARVNVLIPTIDLDHFFAGYIAKFNLALALARRGHRARIVCVDPVGRLPRDWMARVESFAGLAGFGEQVEVAFGRAGGALEVSRSDRFVATTWWTAHIASAAVRDLGAERFLYLIQEYEPFTFPMGTHAALARASYELPHAALFSTELLRDYFRAHRIGVYEHGVQDGDASSAAFDNAITPVPPVSVAELSAREIRRLLFYARPEPHAARNLFELGLLALEQAAEAGAFAEHEWQLHGIGSVADERRIPLGGGLALEVGRRVDQDEYARLLRRHDVGLALMYTPHPSLVPLEMASAGMLTVTSSFENKTAAALAPISSNLIVAAPTVVAVAAALGQAAARVGEFDARVAGGDVRWPRSWEQSFGEPVLAFVERALGLT